MIVNCHVLCLIVIIRVAIDLFLLQAFHAFLLETGWEGII